MVFLTIGATTSICTWKTNSCTTEMIFGAFSFFVATRNKWDLGLVINVPIEHPKIHQNLSNHVQWDGESGDDSLVLFSTAGIGS